MHSLQVLACLLCVVLTVLQFPTASTVTCTGDALNKTTSGADKNAAATCIVVFDGTKSAGSKTKSFYHNADCDTSIKATACGKLDNPSVMMNKFVFCCKTEKCDGTTTGTDAEKYKALAGALKGMEPCDSLTINEVACADIKTKGVTLKKDQYLKLTGTCETSYQLVLPSPPKKVKQLTCDGIIKNGMTLKKDEYVHLNDGTCTLKSCTKSGGKLVSSLLAVVMSVMVFSSHKLM